MDPGIISWRNRGSDYSHDKRDPVSRAGRNPPDSCGNAVIRAPFLSAFAFLVYMGRRQPAGAACIVFVSVRVDLAKPFRIPLQNCSVPMVDTKI